MAKPNPQGYVYRSGEVAKVLQVSTGTVCKLFDKGLLKGYKLTGGDRRIPENNLIEFMKSNGIPLPPEFSNRPPNVTSVTIPKNAFCFFMDGTNWCCVRPDFIDLQVSTAGFGLTFKEAFDDLTERERHERATTLAGSSTVAGSSTSNESKTSDESLPSGRVDEPSSTFTESSECVESGRIE